MYLAGTAPPQALPQGQLVAPVVQAPQGAGEGDIKSLLMKLANQAAKSAGDELGKRMAGWGA